MKFEITAYTHLKRLWLLIVYFILFFSTLYYTFNIKYMMLFCIVGLGIFTIPTLYIHMNYYKYVKDKVLFLEEEEIKIHSLDTNTITIFKISDIKKVKLFMSGSRIANLINKHFMFENYYYYEIELHNNDIVIINSLHDGDIDSILKKKYPFVEIEVINTYYPLIV